MFTFLQGASDFLREVGMSRSHPIWNAWSNHAAFGNCVSTQALWEPYLAKRFMEACWGKFTLRRFVTLCVCTPTVTQEQIQLYTSALSIRSTFPSITEWHISWRSVLGSHRTNSESELLKFLYYWMTRINGWIVNYTIDCPLIPSNSNSEIKAWASGALVTGQLSLVIKSIRREASTGDMDCQELWKDVRALSVYPYLVGESDPTELTLPRPFHGYTVEPPPAAPYTWLQAMKESNIDPTLFISGRAEEEQKKLLIQVLGDPEVNAALKEKIPWLFRSETIVLPALAQRSPPWAKFVAMLYEYAEAKLLKREVRLFPQQELRKQFAKAVQNVVDLATVEELLIYSPSMSPEDSRAAWYIEAQQWITTTKLLEWTLDGSNSIWAHRPMPTQVTEKLFDQAMAAANSCKTDHEEKIRNGLLEIGNQLETCIVARLKALPDVLFASPVAVPIKINLSDTPAYRWTAKAFLSELNIDNVQLLSTLSRFEAHPERMKMLTSDQVVKLATDCGCDIVDATGVAHALNEKKMLK